MFKIIAYFTVLLTILIGFNILFIIDSRKRKKKNEYDDKNG